MGWGSPKYGRQNRLCSAYIKPRGQFVQAVKAHALHHDSGNLSYRVESGKLLQAAVKQSQHKQVRLLDKLSCVHTMYLWLNSSGIQLKRLQTERSTAFRLRRLNRSFTTNLLCNFSMMIILFLKIDFWCLVSAMELVSWLSVIANATRAIPFGLSRQEKPRKMRVNII